MQYIVTAFKVELIKIRRSLAFLVVLAAPAVIALIQIAMYIDYMDFYLSGSERNPWPTFNQTMLTYWALMMLPLFITLEMALLTQMEHKHGNWKLLYSQPVPRWALYIAKYLMGIMLIGLGSLILIGFMLITGNFLYIIYPDYGFNAAFPLLETLKQVSVVNISAALILSIHTWVSLRWNSFVIPVVVGITATIAGLFIFSTDIVHWYPWTIPGSLAIEINMPYIPSVLLGLSGLILIMPVCWHISRLELD